MGREAGDGNGERANQVQQPGCQRSKMGSGNQNVRKDSPWAGEFWVEGREGLRDGGRTRRPGLLWYAR